MATKRIIVTLHSDDRASAQYHGQHLPIHNGDSPQAALGRFVFAERDNLGLDIETVDNRTTGLSQRAARCLCWFLLFRFFTTFGYRSTAMQNIQNYCSEVRGVLDQDLFNVRVFMYEGYIIRTPSQVNRVEMR